MQQNNPIPQWWDEDLHGAGLAALTNEWQTLGDLKPKLGEHSDKVFEIMRDLHELGLAVVETRLIHRGNGSLCGGYAVYKSNNDQLIAKRRTSH